MDRADRALLEALQADSSRSIAELAGCVNLSPSACHRRIKALEEQGLILGYAARVDPRRLGLAVEVFVEITLNSQSREAMDRFERAVCDFDDILECHLMSGTSDYLLRVAAADLDHYDRIHRDCLARLPGVSAMKTSFSLRRIKRFAGYSVPS
ncbi:Lrp/AsnC family transcriptional regulator [Novosphingobium mangrovi (ex Huang et al. 2023)]|uniref:Lrp/AsnC family transcriptional regulator n=1 Tax=Novosphingobium mangrovi (ex Huang et al. 2023) TaxID=2976432 RepID=A0ABT2I369_9SPHN|nr:Lrp/AsnC family transcriptional regulator [Novosphingobium mangrovi (ex Huang et al. 2023)]MCT2399249.1 Lrp/AsnC family transcriptional regulator [Novosphingobium mangrovi (ex Huang et al. 2023)]